MIHDRERQHTGGSHALGRKVFGSCAIADTEVRLRLLGVRREVRKLLVVKRAQDRRLLLARPTPRQRSEGSLDERARVVTVTRNETLSKDTGSLGKLCGIEKHERLQRRAAVGS